MKSEMIGIIMTTGITGVLLILFGSVIKFSKGIDLVLSFDENKHDKDKVLKVFGNNVIAIGIIVTIIGIFSMVFLKQYFDIVIVIQIVVLILGVLQLLYKLNKYCKK